MRIGAAKGKCEVGKVQARGRGEDPGAHARAGAAHHGERQEERAAREGGRRYEPCAITRHTFFVARKLF